jgi:hypothetical protein
MTKIPVGRTIAEAYSFAFRDFLKILGVTWLPMTILWVPGFFLQQRMVAVQQQMTAGDISAFHELWRILLPFYLFAFTLLFMQVIGIAKLALGIKKKPDWFYFSLGKPVWRLIGSCLLLIVAMIVGWLAALLGAIVIGFLTRLLTGAAHNGVVSTIAWIIAVVGTIALWCAYFYAWIRLSFLLVPVVAAEEEGFALARSWTLGLGNFWRMFVILLAVLGPFVILEFVFLLGFMFHGVSFPPAHADAAQTAAFQAAMNARAMQMIGAMNHNWYLTYPAFVVIMVLFYGITVSAQCFAWRALSGTSAPVAGD